MRMLCRTMAGLLAAGVIAASGAGLQAEEKQKEHPLKPVLRMVDRCLDNVQEFPAYEATFTKRELINNRLVAQRMKMKFRREPFSVYFYFLDDLEGREVIYVAGRNGGNLLAHETGLAGLAGTLRLAPTDSLAMNENRHPITEVGIENALLVLQKQWKEESKYGETEVQYYKGAKLGGMECRVIEVSHPRPRRQFPFHKTMLWIDGESGLAVRVQQFGFPVREGVKPPIVEDYAYTDLRTDVRISDRDFDVNNPGYNY